MSKKQTVVHKADFLVDFPSCIVYARNQRCNCSNFTSQFEQTRRYIAIHRPNLRNSIGKTGEPLNKITRRTPKSSLWRKNECEIEESADVLHANQRKCNLWRFCVWFYNSIPHFHLDHSQLLNGFDFKLFQLKLWIVINSLIRCFSEIVLL